MQDDPDFTLDVDDRLQGFDVDRSAGRGNSTFIKFLKFFIFFAMVALAVIMVTWGYFDQDDYVPPVDTVEDVQEAAPQTNELLAPRFDSVDSKGQPYTLIANLAKRQEGGSVYLERPKGDIQLHSGRFLSAQSKDALYYEDTQKLSLKGDVKIFDSAGYSLETAAMEVDLQRNTLNAPYAVRAQGAMGTLRAVNMRADIDRGFLVFKGPATLRIYATEGKASLKGLR